MATSKKQLLEQVKQGDLAGAVQSMLNQMTQLQIVTRIVNDGEGEKAAELLSDSQKICTQINILEGTIDTAIGSGFLSEGAYSSIADGHMNQVAAGCASVRDNIESLQTLLDLAEQANWEGEVSEVVPEAEVNDALAQATEQLESESIPFDDIAPDPIEESELALGAERSLDAALPNSLAPIVDETPNEISDAVSPLEEVSEQGGGLEAVALGGAAIATGAAASLVGLESMGEPAAESPLEELGDLEADLGNGDFENELSGAATEDVLSEDVLGEDLLPEALGNESLFGEDGLGDALEASPLEDALADVDLPQGDVDVSSSGLSDNLNADSLLAESPASEIGGVAEESLDLGLDDSLSGINLEDVNLEDVSLQEAQASEALDGLGLQSEDLSADLGDGLNLELGVDPLEGGPAVSDETLDLSEASEGLDLGGDESVLGESLGEGLDLGMPLETLEDDAAVEMSLEASPELEASGLDGLDLGEEASLDASPDFDDDALAGLDLGGDLGEELGGDG